MKRSGRSGPPHIWCVAKPPGPTSFDIVREARRVSDYRRVGHAGTLDPFAEGLLVLGLGAATRLLAHVEAQTKVYRARVLFGQETDSGDPSGEVIREAPTSFDPTTLNSVLDRFVGEIEQLPPRHSAIRVDGKRAYDRARAGEEFEVPMRSVRVDAIEVLGSSPEHLELRVTCGKGTYIRSLARDIGVALGGAAHLGTLVRERTGTLGLEGAADGENIQRDWEAGRGLFGPEAVVTDWPRIDLDADRVHRVRNGIQPDPAWWGLPGDAELPSKIALFGPDGRLVALARTHSERGLRLSVVLPEES